MTARTIAVAMVAGVLLAACSATVATPSVPTPTTSTTSPSAPSAAPTGTPLDAALQASWTGPPRVISQFTSLSGLRVLEVHGGDIWVRFDLGGDMILRSRATVDRPGSLILTLLAPSAGCAAGSVGTYAWSLAPGGASLTVTASGDACAARAEAFAGTWTRSACRDANDLCLGAMPAGTYVSTFLDLRDASAAVPNWGAYGQLRYTVPAGWANSADFPETYNLVPAADYAGPVGVPDGSAYHTIFVYPRPAATASCANQVDSGVGQTPAALAAWVAGRPGVVATRPASIMIGGEPGLMLDLHLAPSWTTRTCPGDPFPTALLLVGAGGEWNWGLGGTEHQRLILLDIGGGRTVAIFIDDNSTPSRFGQLIAQAMPVVTTFEFPK
ncbi:MAG TPA: hypothetical protein VKR30_02630 [Candidatus Limnocylindrales bacterium]|nr:hypothetical protein [Candidatus Limnocylindrales bacterium]